MKVKSIEVLADWIELPLIADGRCYILQNVSNAPIYCNGTDSNEKPEANLGLLLMLGEKIRVSCTRDSKLWAKTTTSAKMSTLIYVEEN